MTPRGSWLIDPPTPLDTIETWEAFARSLEDGAKLHLDFADELARARKIIAEKKSEDLAA